MGVRYGFMRGPAQAVRDAAHRADCRAGARASAGVGLRGSLQTSTESSTPASSASGSFDPLAGPRRFKSRESPHRRRRRRNHSSPPLPLHHRSHGKHRAAARPHHRTQASRRYAHTHTHRLSATRHIVLIATPAPAQASVSLLTSTESSAPASTLVSPQTSSHGTGIANTSGSPICLDEVVENVVFDHESGEANSKCRTSLVCTKMTALVSSLRATGKIQLHSAFDTTGIGWKRGCWFLAKTLSPIGLMLMWPRSEPLPPHWLTVHTQNNIIKINEDQRLASPSHGRRSRQYGRICTIAAARMGKPESNFPLACESLPFTSSAGVQNFLKKFV